MQSASKKGARSATERTKRKGNALEIFDKGNGSAHLYGKKRTVFADTQKNHFSNLLMTRDIACLLRHTRNRAVDGLLIEDTKNRVENLEADAEKSLVGVRWFRKYVEALESI